MFLKRFMTTIFLVVTLSATFIWAWISFPEINNFALSLFKSGKFKTLEIRHSAESIMEAYKRDLLKDHDHSFLEPDLKFHPYLLMEVKYNRSQDKTGEGVILWSLVDGEMVLSTSSWDKTHGFMDCIQANADKNDFKVINALASHSGSLDRENLLKTLNVENETLDSWLDKCKIKSLIVQNGNSYRLHLQDPKLQVMPETRLDHWLVTKNAKNASRIPKKYRAYQIEKIARAAFGNHFTIRKTTEIFLPVYRIVVQNPDGSQMSTYWNALTGKKFSQVYHIE